MTLRRVAAYLRPYRGKLILLALAATAGIFAELVPPFLIKRIIDDVLSVRGPRRLLVWLTLGLLCARVLIWLSEVCRGSLSAWLGGRITADIRQSLHDHLQHLPMKFYNRWPVGTILSRVIHDAGRIEELVANSFPLIFANALMLTGILIFFFYTNWMLALYTVLPAPVIAFLAFTLWSRLKMALDRQAVSWSRLSGHLVEALAGIRLVKAFCQEEREAALFRSRSDRVMDTTIGAERRACALFSSIYFLMSLGVYLVWYVGGAQVIKGKLTTGELMAIVIYLWMLYWPLQWLAQISGSMSQALVGAGRIFEVLDSEPEAYADPRAIPMPRARRRITFRNVSFGYEGGAAVLHDINLDVAAGEMIGIVGRSGTGKTTLMNLLCRFYDVGQGAIEVDGIDIRRIRLENLRDHIGIVSQNPFLFSGTIAENIRFGRPDAGFPEVMQAAVAANAHSFIMGKPDAYDTQLGECGQGLSGGERQRIAIARAILRDPAILILDEATSLLDARSEAAIQEAIGLVARNRTTFVIAHRLSTVRNADRLIVLDGGRIVEVGSHADLMDRGGLYSKFVTMQHKSRSVVASA